MASTIMGRLSLLLFASGSTAFNVPAAPALCFRGALCTRLTSSSTANQPDAWRASRIARGSGALFLAASGAGMDKRSTGATQPKPLDCSSPTPKVAVDVEKGAFAVGSAVIVGASTLFYSSGHDGTVSGPLFKMGMGIFSIGIMLNYAQTYSRCAYIRFVREAILQPSTVVRRYRRILRMVDGNIFRFLLPGRSYDVGPDGRPIKRK